MEDRAKAFVNYRHFIAIRAKFFFQMMLSQRGYNGKMVFDHGSEILGLQVRFFFFCDFEMLLLYKDLLLITDTKNTHKGLEQFFEGVLA